MHAANPVFVACMHAMTYAIVDVAPLSDTQITFSLLNKQLLPVCMPACIE